VSARQRPLVAFDSFAPWAVAAIALSLAMLWAWSWPAGGSDYALEALPALTALLHGHIATFFSTAPSYGASLVLRAPFALPGSLAGGGVLLVYRLAALPCVLALAALGAWLACNLRRAGGSLTAAVLALALCAANPIAYRVLELGHPEELLGAALCAVAVLVAIRGRAVWAGLLLGVAIANKQWALLAVGPVLVALPAGRWRAMIIAGVVAGGFEAPLLLSAPTVMSGTSRLVVSDTGAIFHPWQIFWFLGARGHWLPAMGTSIARGFRVPPPWLGGRAHLLIVWLGVPLTLLAMWRRTRREDALLLLALLMLLRCWLDPWDVVYYTLPFIVALLAWEITVERRVPLLALAATAAAWLIFQYFPAHLSPDGQALSFLVPSTLALAALTCAVYLRGAVLRVAHALTEVSRPRTAPSGSR
jgi:Glycosyltransferase family 87